MLRADSLVYDARGKVLQAIGTGDSVIYAPLGAVVYSKLVTANKREEFALDALANRRRSVTYGDAGSTDTLEYEAGTARHLATREFGLQEDSTIYLYTSVGDLWNSKRYHFAGHQGFGYLTETRETDNSYTLDLKLTKSVFRLDTVATGIEPPPGYVPYRADETYRYDALGRRIYARIVRGANCATKDRSSGCRSTVTRTVWDGDQVLFEIRVPGDSGANLEVDNYPGVHYGVVGYTHGPGIDQPLDLIKGSEVVVPHTNWRGAFDKATCPVANCSSSR